MATGPNEVTQQRHEEKVKRLVSKVLARPADQKISIKKNTATHQIHDRKWKKDCYLVDVSELNEILWFEDGLDRLGEPTQIAVCEPQVQMEQLAKACLPRGWVPQVVPEYTNFTVAGLINGEGIQSSAFKYGVFTHTVTEIELVLGNGEVVLANLQNEYRDLFIAIPESLCTLGIITLARVALRKATGWVETRYTLFSSLDRFYIAFSDAIRSLQGDFLEGLVVSKSRYLMIHSKFVDSVPKGQEGRIFHPYPTEPEHGERYYYQYIRQVVCNEQEASKQSGSTSSSSQPLDGASGVVPVAVPVDYIQTFEFLFRSMRGAWWMIECHINADWLLNKPWFRRFVDKKVQSEIETKGFAPSGGKHWTRNEMERCFVLQDMGVLLSRLKAGIEFVETNIGVYPLWLCPADLRRNTRESKDPKRPTPKGGEDWIVDVGVYGEPTVKPYKHRRMMPALERFVDCPSVWGVCYHLTKEEVRRQHEPMREKYHASGVFLGLEDKIIAPPPKADADLDEGPIFAWRLYRDHGPFWPLKMVVFFVLLGLLIYLSVRAVAWLL